MAMTCDSVTAVPGVKELGAADCGSSPASTTGCGASPVQRGFSVDEGDASALKLPSSRPPLGASAPRGGGASESESREEEEEEAPQQLQAGLFTDDEDDESAESSAETAPAPPPTAAAAKEGAESQAPTATPSAPTGKGFERGETFFIFDWDDTILPSTWVQRQGLRLDAASTVTPAQREALAEVAVVAGRTLQAARKHGTVILVTNAERGWIELSCQKFLPTLAPMLENFKLVSARTTYEPSTGKSPQGWKLKAFEVEITSFFGAEVYVDASKRKNVFSLGDSIHEREALLRATASVPGCFSKSLKFTERPDIRQICKQHELISNAFGQMVDHEGHLDLSIQCP